MDALFYTQSNSESSLSPTLSLHSVLLARTTSLLLHALLLAVFLLFCCSAYCLPWLACDDGMCEGAIQWGIHTLHPESLQGHAVWGECPNNNSPP